MSLSALAAATAPNRYGSSSTGAKKSSVCTIAWASFRRYTAASSATCRPTSRSGAGVDANVAAKGRRTCARAAGPILDAQPPQETRDVSRTGVVVIAHHLLPVQAASIVRARGRPRQAPADMPECLRADGATGGDKMQGRVAVLYGPGEPMEVRE